jgi:hypothetical protein
MFSLNIRFLTSSVKTWRRVKVLVFFFKEPWGHHTPHDLSTLFSVKYGGFPK